MTANPELPPDNSEHARITRVVNHELDIVNSRIEPQFEENNYAATAEAEQLIHGVDEYMSAAKEGLSPEEVKYFLQKLDTAIAITNDPVAREIRKNLIERYGES
jgi:CBS-domain-containing membrane protein